jgi:H+/gluconate symporter-like permease
VFYFFSHRTKYFEIHCQPANGTFGFARCTSRPFAKPKEPFFAITQTTTMETINLIGSICSILGFLVAVFLTTQVISIKNKMTDNSNNKVKQEKNKVKNGDIAGRDVNK